MLNFAHRRINNCTMEVAKVRSLQGCYQKVLVIPNLKEHLVRLTNEEVMLDYPRSTKWKMCCPHCHARDVTLDDLIATP